MFGTEAEIGSVEVFELSEHRAKWLVRRNHAWIWLMVPPVIGVGVLVGPWIGLAVIGLFGFLFCLILFSKQLADDEFEVPVEWRRFFVDVIEASGEDVRMVSVRCSQGLPHFGNQALMVPAEWLQSWAEEELGWLLVSWIRLRAAQLRMNSIAAILFAIFMTLAMVLFSFNSRFTPPSLLLNYGSATLAFLHIAVLTYSPRAWRKSDRFATEKLGKEAAERALNRLWLEKKKNMMLPITLDDIEKRAKRLGIELATVETEAV